MSDRYLNYLSELTSDMYRHKLYPLIVVLHELATKLLIIVRKKIA